LLHAAQFLSGEEKKRREMHKSQIKEDDKRKK
jgi:hypothetical protein